MCNSDRPYDGDADNVTLPTRPIVHSITVYNNLVVMKYWYNTILLWHLGEFVVRGLPYGSGLGLSRCLGPGECLHSFKVCSARVTSLLLLLLLLFKVVVDGRHKNQSGLFHYLSGARAAPGVGQLGR